MPGLLIDLSDGSPPVLHIRGDVDIANAEQLNAALENALSVDPRVVLDMGDVTFIDGAGLRVIVHAAESRDGAGPLTLLNASRVEWLLGRVGLEAVPSIDFKRNGDGHVR